MLLTKSSSVQWPLKREFTSSVQVVLIYSLSVTCLWGSLHDFLYWPHFLYPLTMNKFLRKTKDIELKQIFLENKQNEKNGVLIHFCWGSYTFKELNWEWLRQMLETEVKHKLVFRVLLRPKEQINPLASKFFYGLYVFWMVLLIGNFLECKKEI